jgi:CRISPR/Cas system CMR-associated protein Cmr5 small subunit
VENDLKNELHHVLSGKNEVSFGRIIQAIANYLKNGKTTGQTIERTKHFKSKEEKRLTRFAGFVILLLK